MTLVSTAAPHGVGHGREDRCQRQRVLVVDENELIQDGLSSVLARVDWVSSCFVASSAETALQAVRRYQPQMVLVSTTLGGRSGPELSRTLKQQMPHIKIVLMTGDGRVSSALATSLGAVGVLSKYMSRGAIVDAVQRIALGGRVFPKRWVSQGVRLSQRELDVLQHLAAGLSNPETAATLNLSRHTVKQHSSAVYRKLGVRNRAEAASRAQELGLLAWTTGSGGQLRAG